MTSKSRLLTGCTAISSTAWSISARSVRVPKPGQVPPGDSSSGTAFQTKSIGFVHYRREKYSLQIGPSCFPFRASPHTVIPDHQRLCHL
ncbi:hypothetical protein FA95DRAFT_1369955 [Auriscalpium vulgare]|uniref:Uncharacterized protein n=1 Tax=Auriscalpium vulgare TaxID=40419 RepID=A0ACB8R1P1_9AGAM|nr:hypothetical protein FA95DRAFT_1369955 [Auriscalpium vulgare]